MSQQVRSIRMEDYVFFKMKAISKLEGRSTTKQIEHALMQYISNFEQSHGTLDISEYSRGKQ